MSNKIVVSIPLKLESRQDIASALLDLYGTNYLFIGRIFQETATNTSCEITITSALDCHSDLSKAIELEGQNKISAASLKKIGQTQQIVRLTSTDVGYQACLTIAKFAQVFLNIGGLAVRIESAEIAHEANKWLSSYNSEDVFDIYSLYVGLIEGDRNYYSCGMHNFGKADVAIDLTEDIGLAIYVMNVFNYYRLTESPILQDGHTFQPDIESPSYHIKLIEDDEYETNTLQHNDLGRWYLSRS